MYGKGIYVFCLCKFRGKAISIFSFLTIQILLRNINISFEVNSIYIKIIAKYLVFVYPTKFALKNMFKFIPLKLVDEHARKYAH